MPTKKLSADHIVGLMCTSIKADDPPGLLHDVVADILVYHNIIDSYDQAFETAETVLQSVKELLLSRQAEAERDGLVWSCELYGSEDEYVRGSSFRDPTLSDEERRVRANRIHIKSAKEALVSLTPSEFELVCTRVLELMGCSEPKTSPIRDDGGIDFYGRLHLRGRLDSSSPLGGIDGRVNIWLLGQAKHYPKNRIQTAHVRELVGSVELARTGGAIHTWEGLHLRPFDATLQLLFTTGSFTSGAERLLDKSGMISMNGDQLATFLCDAGVGVDELSNSFDSNKFREGLGIVPAASL